MSAASPTASVPPPLPSSPWTEHRNAQGRVYWYHQVEKRSVWEKPTELKTARERALDSTPWKEYQKGDRKYYVHSVTKESSWTLPPELKDLFDTIPDEPSPAATPVHAQRDTQSPFSAPPQASPPGPAQRPIYAGPPPGFASPNDTAGGSASPGHALQASAIPPRGPIAPTAPAAAQPPAVAAGRTAAPVLVAGGEEAFMQLLREKGVDATWTWESTMRAIITEPLYKALGTLAERKAAFSKYVRNLELEAEKAKREQANAQEPSIRKMMEGPMADGRIQPWLSYEGMLLRCPDTSVWRRLEAIGMAEAQNLWEQMRKEQREKEATRKRELRHRNMDVFMSLLKSFEADVMTRWKDARQTVHESDEWQSDANLREMDSSDMVAVFDELIKSIEKQKVQELKDEAHKRHRDGRKRRDWFRRALQDGKKEGWLTVRTTFDQVYIRFRGEAQFQDMLGQSGSSPLDLFYDVLDELESELGKVLRAVEHVLRAHQPDYRVTESTTLSDFNDSLNSALQNASGSEADKIRDSSEEMRQLVFEELMQIAKEETRRIERKLRHLGEDLRYALKKVAYHQPELFEEEGTLDKPWEEWKPKLQALKLREWEAFDRTPFRIEEARIEETQQTAWKRFVGRQKEKMAERKAREASAEAHAGSHTPRKRRGDEEEDDAAIKAERRRSSRRSGEDEKGRLISRRERRAGEMDEIKERERHERRSGYIDEPSAAKRARHEEGEVDGHEDSEKEEGEV